MEEEGGGGGGGSVAVAMNLAVGGRLYCIYDSELIIYSQNVTELHK